MGRAAEIEELGEMLPSWRQPRRRSRSGLSLDAGLSTPHPSLAETGWAKAGREVVLRLATELRGQPIACDVPPAARRPPPARIWGGVALPPRLGSRLGEFTVISTTTVFGTPLDLARADLAIEAFFPADAATARALGALQASASTSSA